MIRLRARTLLCVTAACLLATAGATFAQTPNNNEDTAAQAAENDGQAPRSPKEICEDIIEKVTAEASKDAAPEQVSKEAYLEKINQREKQREQVSTQGGEAAPRLTVESRRAEAEQMSGAVKTANDAVLARVDEARQLLKKGKVAEAGKLLKEVRDIYVPNLKQVVAGVESAATGTSSPGGSSQPNRPGVKLGSGLIMKQLKRMASDQPTQPSVERQESQLPVQRHEFEGTAANPPGEVLPGEVQNRGIGTTFFEGGAPATTPRAAPTAPQQTRGAPAAPGASPAPAPAPAQQPAAGARPSPAATAPSTPTTQQRTATPSPQTTAPAPARTTAQQSATGAAPSPRAASAASAPTTSQRPPQAGSGQSGQQGASGPQAQQGQPGSGTGRQWNPQLEGRLGPTGGGIGRDWSPKLEGRLGPTGGGIGRDWKAGQDIRGYDRQQVALVTGDGRKVSIKPFITALEKVSPTAAREPLVRHAPAAPGGREVVRLSPAAQRALVENRDQLRKVGGVELDVTFQALSLLGVPEMRTEGPAILIENPVMISLRRLVDAAKPYAGSAERWQSLPDDIRYPGGIGRVRGYVIDPDAKDVFIVGTAAPSRETRLDIDLITVLMETVWSKGLTPAISLDPRPDDIGGPQYSRVINLPSDALVTRIMLDADYEMKRINFGLVKVGDPNFSSLADILKREKPRGKAQLSTRFWFHPIPLNPNTVRVSETGNVVLYDAGVQLLTETMKVQKAGMTGTGEADPVATRAAEEFTRFYARFETSPAIKPQGVYALLHGVVDIVTMCKILRESEIDFPVLDDVRGLPYRHLSGKEAVPTSYPGVKARVQGVGAGAGVVHVLSGGVQLRSRPSRRSVDQFEDYVGTFLEHAAESFRSGGFVQKISLTFTLPAQQVGGSAAAELAKQVGFRELAAKRPAAAAQRFREATSKDPVDIDAWVYLGLAEAQAGRHAEARRAIEQARLIDPGDSTVQRVGLQIAFLADPALLLEAIDPRLRMELSIEYELRGQAAMSAGDYTAAIESASQAIKSWPKNADAYLLRGLAQIFKVLNFTKIQSDVEIRSDLDNAIRILREEQSLDTASAPGRLAKALAISALQRLGVDQMQETIRVLDAKRGDLAELEERWAKAYIEANEARTLDKSLELAIAMEVQAFTRLLYVRKLSGAHVNSAPAKRLADDAVARFPDYVTARTARGFLHMFVFDDNAAAERDFSEVISRNPDLWPWMYFVRGYVRAGQGKCPGAHEDLDHYVKRNIKENPSGADSVRRFAQGIRKTAWGPCNR